MNRILGGGVALTFAATAAVGLAAPVGADEVQVEWDLTELDWASVNVDHEPLEGSISPDPVAPGGEVTVTGECDLQRLSDPRHDHEVRWALVQEGQFPGWEGLPEGLMFTAVDQGRVDVPGQGEENEYNWEATFAAPTDAGEYSFVAICVPIDLPSYPHCNVGTYGPADLTFEVDETLPPETTVPPTTQPEDEEEDTPDVPPAQPVTGTPAFTG